MYLIIFIIFVAHLLLRTLRLTLRAGSASRVFRAGRGDGATAGGAGTAGATGHTSSLTFLTLITSSPTQSLTLSGYFYLNIYLFIQSILLFLQFRKGSIPYPSRHRALSPTPTLCHGNANAHYYMRQLVLQKHI